ncbi:MAG: DUF3109 family protein [Bacteroidota bacterium]|nr:DUF3109 family protein [Bacteroidota bacterium]
MVVIDNIIVHESVAETKFACDLKVCKGACCTFPGGRGAPLLDEEVFEIEKAFPFIETLLPPEHLSAIENHGLVDGFAGNYATQCVDGKACVFVYYENDIAYCAFEKAFVEKKIQFRKPISCHLFPIRVDRDGNGIHFEYFSECDPALENGKQQNISVHRFAKEPLERTFGKKWTEKLTHHIDKDCSH